MADNHDLQNAIHDTDERTRDALTEVGHENVDLVNATLAIASAIREAAIRLEIALREATNRFM